MGRIKKKINGGMSPMVLTAGVITVQSVQSNTAQLSATAASGGTGPYTMQWYRSQTSGFTPGGGNILTGQTSLTLNDEDMIPNTVYYYKLVYTDTGHSNDQVTATQVTLTTDPASLNISSFAMDPFLGMVDLKVGGNVVSAEIDASQSTPLYAGSFVKVVTTSNGLPKVVGIAADTDNAMGVITYDVKSRSFEAGDRCEIAMNLSCVWLYATTAINANQEVCPDLPSQGAVKAATGSDRIVGFAYDAATAYGELIRVMLSTPSFKVNS